MLRNFWIAPYSQQKGHDEKGCLLWTEKKAAVDVDQLKKAGCTFQLVDVDGQRWQNKKDVCLSSEEMKFFLFFQILSFWGTFGNKT